MMINDSFLGLHLDSGQELREKKGLEQLVTESLQHSLQGWARNSFIFDMEMMRNERVTEIYQSHNR